MGNPNPDPRFVRSIVGAFGHDGIFHGETVLRPDLLTVNERALELAEEEVLEGGEREHGENLADESAQNRPAARSPTRKLPGVSTRIP